MCDVVRYFGWYVWSPGDGYSGSRGCRARCCWRTRAAIRSGKRHGGHGADRLVDQGQLLPVQWDSCAGQRLLQLDNPQPSESEFVDAGLITLDAAGPARTLATMSANHRLREGVHPDRATARNTVRDTFQRIAHMPLTPRQKRFAQEYLIDLNASAAYRRVDRKAKRHTAEQQASVLMRNGEVKAEVERLIAAREKRTQITADRVLRELALLAFSSIDDYELDDDGRIVLRPGVEPDAMRAVRRTRFRQRPVVGIPPRRRRCA